MANLALYGYWNRVLNVVSVLRYLLRRLGGEEDLLWLEFAIPGSSTVSCGKKKSEATIASLSPISSIALTRASIEE